MLQVRPFLPSDWPAVEKIYQEGIDTDIASLDAECPDWQEWDNRFLPFCRLVIYEEDEILGWVALSRVSERAVFSGVAEVTIYISSHHQGEGLGSLLLKKLVEESEKNGIWTLQSVIAVENMASQALHKKAGFRVVGFRERIGQRHGIWRDRVLMERRSEKVGI